MSVVRVGLRADSWSVNKKRVRRPWRDEGLRVVRRKRKKPLRGKGHVGAFCPIRPNVLWALDFQFNQTTDARTLKLFNVIDEYTRERPAILVDRNIDTDKVATLDRIAAERGAPKYIRCDNGPELIAAAVADWCRFNTSNLTVAERMDRELQRPAPRRGPRRRAVRLLARGTRRDRRLADRLQHEPPHSSLGYLTPTEYANRWHQHQQPQPKLS
jgi:putative transposase